MDVCGLHLRESDESDSLFIFLKIIIQVRGSIISTEKRNIKINYK